MSHEYSISKLEEFLQQVSCDSSEDSVRSIMDAMYEAQIQRLDQLPYPGEGRTYRRWQALSRFAAGDLSLCKIFESHTDALASFHELGTTPPVPDGIWAMWAAEPRYARVNLVRKQGPTVTLQGCKAWCSGATYVDNALMTAWEGDQQYLVALSLKQEGITLQDDPWQAVGMNSTKTVSVHFDGVSAELVGEAGSYLDRPGFWHGAGGIAACWYGAAQGIAEVLRRHCRERSDNAFALAHLGTVDTALSCAQHSLQQCARWVDEYPQENAELVIRQVRSICEKAAAVVIEQCSRALGAGLYCTDHQLARKLCDLPVYLSQTHADHDLAALGTLVAQQEQGSWQL